MARQATAEGSGQAERARLIRSTAVFAILTAFSRVLGLVREIMAARYFGVQGGPINAFTVAFQVPNLVRALVADAALSSAFVPVFGELLERGERRRAWQVASTVFWIMLLGLTALTAVFIVAAPWIMRVFGYEETSEALVIGLSRVLFPIVMLLGLTGVIVGILNAHDHFAVPALTPVLWNLAIIAALVGGEHFFETDADRLYVYAWGILAGTLIQALAPVPWLRGRGGRLRAVIDLRDPAVRRVFALMFPVTLGLGLINFNLLVDTYFATAFLDKELAPAAIDRAFRIYMLPQGIFSVAVTTVLFPTLARLAVRDDVEGFRDALSAGLRQIGFLLIPASAVSAVLATPIVRLLYEGGDFGASDTDVVAACLAAFSVGLVFNGTMLLLNRAFFSLQSPWIPTWVALGNLGLNAVLDAMLYRLGIWGIPLATSIVNVAGTLALLWLLRRRLASVGEGAVILSYLRIAAASAAAAAAAWGVWKVVDAAAGRALEGRIASVAAALAVASLVYLVSARLLGIRELDALLSLVRRRRGGGETAPNSEG